MKESESLRWMGPARYDLAGFKVFMKHKYVLLSAFAGRCFNPLSVPPLRGVHKMSGAMRASC